MADFFQNKINQYLGDISRSAKFHIVIEPPTGLSLEISKPNELNAKNKLTGAEFNNAIQYFCTAGSFPGLTGETIEFKYRGRTIPIPGVVNPNQTWTATFYNDEAHGIRKFFKDWIERTQMWVYKDDDINTERTQDSFIGSYIAVYQWDFELKNKTVIYYLYQPFPVTMSDVEVSYENMNQVQTFTVEFRYVYFDIAYADATGGNTTQDIKSMVKNTINTLKSTAINAVKDTAKSIGKDLLSSARKNLGIDDFIEEQKQKATTFLADAKSFFTGTKNA